jgi:hypothetical protein
MKMFFQKHHRVLFYSTWLLLVLLQSASTELIADEAYYWVYSKFPAWGYFDHPPMIAILIKCGYALFQNEFGVRLICALMSTLTILIAESLTERKNPFLFYTIVLSIGALQITGFLAVPDTPLLFFTAFYFYSFRYYLKNFNVKGTLLFALSITLLFYTKYHGLLIVLFSVLSNIKLITRRQSWLAAFSVIVLYAPHILWQWEHNWISFRYHLFESNVNPYKFSYTTDYLLGQLLLAGPLAGLILLPAAILYTTRTETERALKFTMVGIYLLFFISSFRGKVEANWPMPVLIPLIVLSHQYLTEKISWIKPLKIIAVVSLLLIIAGRIYLVVDIGPDNALKNRFHNNKAWAKTIVDKTGNKPVVFYNSYQRASLFWFYSGKPSHSHNAYYERRNNYDFWPTEASLLGRPVFIANIYNIGDFADSVKTKKGWVGFSSDTMYAALGDIEIITEQKKINIRETKTIILKCKRKISRWYWTFLSGHKDLKTELLAGIFKGKEMIKEFKTEITAQQLANSFDGFDVLLNFENIPTGKYVIRLGIQSKGYPPTHNSRNIDVEIR